MGSARTSGSYGAGVALASGIASNVMAAPSPSLITSCVRVRRSGRGPGDRDGTGGDDDHDPGETFASVMKAPVGFAGWYPTTWWPYSDDHNGIIAIYGAYP
jgi:hypothetical protein